MAQALELVLTGGLLLAGDCRAVRPGDLGVAGGRIAAITPPGGLAGQSARRVVPLGGRLVVPGFHDSHLHLVEGARALLEVDLRACSDPSSFARSLRAAAAETPGPFLVGRGWEEERVLEDGRPTRELLDRLCPAHAAVLLRVDGHSAWLNTRALAELGVDALGARAEEVPREASGTPTGLIYEGAVTKTLGRLARRLPRSYVREALRRLSRALVAVGVTAVNDMVTEPRDLPLYRAMQRHGELAPRIHCGLRGGGSPGRSFGTAGPRTGCLRAGPVKYFLDGSFGSRTAALYEPYADEPGQRGFLLHGDDQVRRIVAEAVRARTQLAWHAIGDRAVGQLLAAYEAVGPVPGLRHRVEHLQIVRPEDIVRFARLGLVASFQPVFLYERALTRARLGPDRAARAYRLRSFEEAGVPLLLNTDWPYGGAPYPAGPGGRRYTGFEPLLGIHAACGEVHEPAERVTAADALRAYTATAAWADFAEDANGAIRVGYLADLAVLDRNILAVPVEEILQSRVDMTVIGGRVVYERG